MSVRAQGLLLAAALFVMSGCALLALEYAPLPESWNAFLLAVMVLASLFWATLILGFLVFLLIAIYEVARRFGRAGFRAPPKASSPG